MKSFATPDLDEALARLCHAIDQVQACDLDQFAGDDLTDRLADYEILARRVDSVRVDFAGEIERQGTYRTDGHASTRVLLRHQLQLSDGQAGYRARAANMLRSLPETAKAFADGEIGADQVAVLSRVWANPRIKHLMGDRDETFCAKAQVQDYRHFRDEVAKWADAMDVDGPKPNHNARRDFRISQNEIDKDFDIAGSASPLTGVRLKETFDYYVEAETLADWEKARAEHGAAATAEDLPRTAAQRRADALERIFEDAATNPNGPAPAKIIHNIVWNEATYTEMARRFAGKAPSPLDPDDLLCHTMNGERLDPTEAFADSLINHIRRVITNTASVTIDLGEARLFIGNARDAALLQSDHCIWPGCHVPTTRCEVDHHTPHSQGGRTNPGNEVAAETGGHAVGDTTRSKNKDSPSGETPPGTGTPPAPTAPKPNNRTVINGGQVSGL